MRAALPRRLRQRLAEIILDAVHDGRTRRRLNRLGADAGFARSWCAPDDAAYGDLVRERARRAAEALGALALTAPRDLDEALEVAAVLFDAALFFEAHEVLEPYWRRTQGDTRQALQGLIQIAVGYQHWAHGNLLGARALLKNGAARLRGRRARDLGFEGFGAAVAQASSGAEPAPLSAPPFPRRPQNPHLDGKNPRP